MATKVNMRDITVQVDIPSVLDDEVVTLFNIQSNALASQATRELRKAMAACDAPHKYFRMKVETKNGQNLQEAIDLLRSRVSSLAAEFEWPYVTGDKKRRAYRTAYKVEDNGDVYLWVQRLAGLDVLPA